MTVPSLLVTTDAVTATVTGSALSPTAVTGTALIQPPTATAQAVVDSPSAVPTTHIILAGSYSEDSQEINRVFVIGQDTAGEIVTASDEQEVL